jgi:hypothetical protein
MIRSRTIDKTMDESDAAACVADRLREPDDGLVGAFAWVDGRLVCVFGETVSVPGWGEGDDDE